MEKTKNDVLGGGPRAGGAAGGGARGGHESEWAAIRSIAEKMGCTPETLRKWVRQAERDAGERAGLTTDERERLKELERENRELRRANEILRKARRISRRRSSTADRSDDRVHRRAPRGLRGRADLRGVADRPVDLLPAPGAGARSRRRGRRGCSATTAAGEIQRVWRENFRRLRRRQGLAAARPRRACASRAARSSA